MFLAFTGGRLTAEGSGDSVLVKADRQTLEVVKDSIELAGAAEGEEPEVGEILGDNEVCWIWLSRATFCLFLQFEVMHYLEVVEDFSAVPGSKSEIEDPAWKAYHA